MLGRAIPDISHTKGSMQNLVYVQHQDSTPLMPTSNAKARHLLKTGRAQVVMREPFTIQLTIPSGKHTQPVTVGVDMGAKMVGLAAESNGRALYQGEVQLRTNVHKRMEQRAMYRRSRRGRKTRYRKPRFDNRSASRRQGRLPPSIQSKVDTTVKSVRRVASILPVTAIHVEVANFDTQAMKAGKSRLANWAYQHGPLYQEENIKMYIRARDKYTCQYCGEVMPQRLEIDHIIPVSRGGATVPDNLVASCHDCNQAKGSMTAAEFGRPEVQARVKRRLKMAAHTQAGKTATLEGLSEIAPVRTTFGYITKRDRIGLGFPKTHFFDALVIASQGQPIEPLSWYNACKAVQKGNYRQRRGAHSQRVASLPREVFGFRQWDKVKLPDGQIGFVKARRKTGSFSVCDIFGDKVRDGITYRKLDIVARASTLLTQIVNVDIEDMQSTMR